MINLSRIILVFVAFLVMSLISCNKTLTNSEKVTLLIVNPKIDSILDPILHQLKTRDFKHIWQFDNPATDAVKVSYRTAYSPTNMYLYSETINDSINYRPRSFVNGEGFNF